MFPTGDEELYPLLGLFGWVQTLELVGTGMQLVVVAAAFEVVVDDLAGVVLAAGQV